VRQWHLWGVLGVRFEPVLQQLRSIRRPVAGRDAEVVISLDLNALWWYFQASQLASAG
jgi:hypothetical protein